MAGVPQPGGRYLPTRPFSGARGPITAAMTPADAVAAFDALLRRVPARGRLRLHQAPDEVLERRDRLDGLIASVSASMSADPALAALRRPVPPGGSQPAPRAPQRLMSQLLAAGTLYTELADWEAARPVVLHRKVPPARQIKLATANKSVTQQINLTGTDAKHGDWVTLVVNTGKITITRAGRRLTNKATRKDYGDRRSNFSSGEKLRALRRSEHAAAEGVMLAGEVDQQGYLRLGAGQLSIPFQPEYAGKKVTVFLGEDTVEVHLTGRDGAGWLVAGNSTLTDEDLGGLLTVPEARAGHRPPRDPAAEVNPNTWPETQPVYTKAEGDPSGWITLGEAV